jgi:hypothetical protein
MPVRGAARMPVTLHAYECACERKAHAQPDSFAVTGRLCTIALVANILTASGFKFNKAHGIVPSRYLEGCARLSGRLPVLCHTDLFERS